MQQYLKEYAEVRKGRLDQSAIDELNRQAEAGVYDGRPQDLCRRSNAVYLRASFEKNDRMDRVPDTCVYANEWRENLWPYFDALEQNYGEYDWRPSLKQSRIPRLIIHGREDAFPLAGAYAWTKGFPQARLKVLSPAGHFPFIEQPQGFFAAVETFLQGEWPEGSEAVND